MAAVISLVVLALAVGFDPDPEAPDTSNTIGAWCIFGLLAVAASTLVAGLAAILNWPSPDQARRGDAGLELR
jgi:hypothetical protein